MPVGECVPVLGGGKERAYNRGGAIMSNDGIKKLQLPVS